MKNTALFVAGAVALGILAMRSSSTAEGPTMVDLAQRLYAKASPGSFDEKCSGRDSSLEVTGDRHACSTSARTMVVRFAGEQATEATVIAKGIHKGVLGQLKRKLGAPDSVKTMGALKMHFWFTDKATVAVGFQSSSQSRTTMVSFRSPS